MKKTLLWGAILITNLFTLGSCNNDDEDELVGNWVKRSDFDGVARSAAATFTIDGTVYVGTGYDGRNYLKDLWAYNPTAGTWTQRASMPEEASARNLAVGFATSQYGFVGLGRYNYDYLGDFWKYDPQSNSWAKAADFGGSARYAAMAFGINGYGYVGTGYDGNYLKDFWKYDPAADSWEQLPSIGGSKRIGAMTFIIDDIVYLVGGEANSSLASDFWAYDASTDTWSEKRSITDATSQSFDDDYTSIARAFAAAFVIDGKGYLACGDRLGSLVSTTWEYNPETDLWKERTSFEKSSRFETIGFSSGGRGFVVTGRSYTAQYDDMHEFHPTQEYDEYD